MMHRFIILIYLISFGFYSNSQVSLDWVSHPVNEQIKGNDMESNDVAVDDIGNAYVVGVLSHTADMDPGLDTANLTSINGSDDSFVAKYDVLGNYLWSFLISGTLHDVATVVRTDSDNNIIVLGYFEGTADFDPSSGTHELSAGSGKDTFIAKYDANGNLIWAINIGSNLDVRGTSLAVDSANDLFVTGYYTGTADFDPSVGNYLLTAPGTTAFCLKLSAGAIFQWALNIGGPGTELGFSICVDSANNIYIVGEFSGTTDLDPSTSVATHISNGSGDAFLLKLDPNGSYLWSNSFGGTGEDIATSVACESGGDVYVSGTFRNTVDFDPSTGSVIHTSQGITDIFVSKFAVSGNFMWNFAVGAEGIDHSRDIAQDGLGGLYITGSFIDTVDFDAGPGLTDLIATTNGFVYVAKYSTTSGDLEWAKHTTSPGSSKIAIYDDKVYISGPMSDSSYFDPPSGGLLASVENSVNSFLAQYSLNGSYNWSGLIGSYSDESKHESEPGLDFKSSGNVVIAGTFEGSLVFDPGVPGSTVISNGGTDVYIAEYTPEGNLIWVKSFGGPNDDFGGRLVVDSNDDIFLVGTFRDSVDFDSVGIVPAKYSFGERDAFFSKHDASGNLIWVQTFGGSGDDSPNDISISSDGAIFLSGGFSGTCDFDPSTSIFPLTSIGASDLFISKYSSSGSLIWAKTFGGASGKYLFDHCLYNDSLFIQTGYFFGTIDFDPGPGTFNLTASSAADAFVVAFDTAGLFHWAFQINGSYSQVGTSLLFDQNNLYVSGYFYNFADFDPTPSAYIVNSAGETDLFVAKYDANQQLQFVHTAGSTGQDDGGKIVFDNAGFLWQTGRFSESIDFDPGPANYIISSSGYTDIFISKIDTSNGAHIWTKSIGGLDMVTSGDLKINSSNELFLSADFTFTIDVDPSTNNYPITSLNSYDCFIAKFNPCIITSDTLNISSCNQTIINGQLLNATGTYVQSIANTAGCDSILTVNFTLLSSSSVLDTSACAPFISPSGNEVYDVDGVYLDTLINYLGCDSIITITLDILSASAAINLSDCDSVVSPSGSYIWYGDGLYADTLVNSLGCDSILAVTVNIHKSYDTIFVSECEQYNSPSGNHIWNSNGMYSDTLTNINGCDSIISINLTILNSSYHEVNAESCEGIQSPSGNYYWSTSGTYMDTLTNSAGCDSILTVNLTIISFDNTVTQNFDVLTANQSGAAYQWLDCGAGMTSIPGAIEQNYTAIQDGLYAVTVVYDGCTYTTSCSQVLGLSILTNQNLLLSVYPNPLSENTTISFGAEPTDAYHIKIYDLLGQLVYSNENLTGLKNDIPLNFLQSGTYLLTVCDAGTNEIFYNQRIIIL